MDIHRALNCAHAAGESRALPGDPGSQGTHTLNICQINDIPPISCFWSYGRWRKCHGGYDGQGFVLLEGMSLRTDMFMYANDMWQVQQQGDSYSMGTRPGSSTLAMSRLPSGAELDREGAGGPEHGLKGRDEGALRTWRKFRELEEQVGEGVGVCEPEEVGG